MEKLDSSQVALIVAVISLVASLLVPVIRAKLGKPVSKATAANLTADTLKTISEVVDQQANQIERLRKKMDVLESKVECLEQKLHDKQGLIDLAKEIIHKLLAILKRENIQHQVHVPPGLMKEDEDE